PQSASTGRFTQVGVGGYHTCALRSDGVVECWGANEYGQAPATRTAATGSLTQVSGGFYHTCALRSDGVVECWGDNAYGQAPGTKTATPNPSCAPAPPGLVSWWPGEGNANDVVDG